MIDASPQIWQCESEIKQSSIVKDRLATAMPLEFPGHFPCRRVRLSKTNAKPQAAGRQMR
jgi:hypothetical protein